MFSAFICEVAQLSSSFSLAAMLKNVQESQNPLFKNSIKMEKQEKTCCFHLFRISKLLKLETRDLHSLKDLFKSFPMVIYFSYFEENEEWFLKALRSASFFFERLSTSVHKYVCAQVCLYNNVNRRLMAIGLVFLH